MKKLATAVLCALTLTACTPTAPEKHPDPSVTPTTQSLTPDPSPSPSPEPSKPPSPEPSPSLDSPSPSPTVSMSPEQEAAAETVLEFFRIMDATKGDVEADLQPLADISDGELRTISMQTIRRLRSKGVKQGGTVRYEIMDLSAAHKQDGETQVIVTACSDARQIQTLDATTGQHAEGITPVPFLTYEITVADRYGWKVVTGRNWKTESCPAMRN